MGKLSPHNITRDSLYSSLIADGGIFLGLDFTKKTISDRIIELKLPSSLNLGFISIDEYKSYYLIIAMYTPYMDFHFARLYSDGWWTKYSSITHMTHIYNKINIPNGRYNVMHTLCKKQFNGTYNPLGYFLFPSS